MKRLNGNHGVNRRMSAGEQAGGHTAMLEGLFTRGGSGRAPGKEKGEGIFENNPVGGKLELQNLYSVSPSRNKAGTSPRLKKKPPPCVRGAHSITSLIGFTTSFCFEREVRTAIC